jgi:SAM-dependent methyltransferase
LLASAILDRKPGKALDFGMGQGRNTVFLATQGWDVTGFDPSEEGVRLAQAGAAKAGVKIHAVAASDDQFDFGVAQWDLIAMTYVRSPTAHDAARIRRALAPGGIFVYENGSDRHNELLSCFSSFESCDSKIRTPSRTGIPPKKSAWNAWWRRSHRSNISS